MADLFLTWDEAQGEHLPHYCVTCAAPATEWADWQICQTRYQLLRTQYTHVDVTLPVCPQHRNPSWFILHRVIARDVLEDGVILGHVSPGFVQAVWDFRDETADQPVQVPARGNALGSGWADFEEDSEDFGPRTLPRRRHTGNRYVESPGWSLARIVSLSVAALFFAPFVLLMMCGVLGLLLSLIFG